MSKIYFHIYKGKPLSQDDNREEVYELHVLVQFSAPEVHAELMDSIDRRIVHEGQVLEYVRDMRSGHGIIDVAFKPGITEADGIMKAMSAAEAFCTQKNYQSHIFMGKPKC